MTNRIYAFEKLEVYHEANQLARIIGAVIASLPEKKDPVSKRLIRCSITLGQGIAGGNVELPTSFSLEDRRQFLNDAIAAAREIRRACLDLRRAKCGSQPHLVEGLDVLQRIEAGLCDNLDRVKPGFDPSEYAAQQTRRIAS